MSLSGQDNKSTFGGATLRNIVHAGRSRFALIIGLLCVAAFSAATDPDWGATISGAQTDITEQLTTYGPLVVGLIVFIAGFKFVVSWIRGALAQMRSR